VGDPHFATDRTVEPGLHRQRCAHAAAAGRHRTDLRQRQDGNSTTLSSLAKGTGVYKTVPALRKKYGADMVTLIRPFYMSAQGGNCGVGYIGGYNGSNIAGYGSYAYSVVSDGKDAGGSNYYCTDYTFTHELGHNMGLMHDRDTVARQGGGKGSYDYAFGHGRSGSFGSIMSYISPVIGRFSNPTQTDCGGSFACGVVPGSPASAHNALALTNNRTAVAAFTGTTLAHHLSGVGHRFRAPASRSPNVAVNASNGGSCTASGKTGAYACTVPWGWSGVIAPVVGSGSVTPGSIQAVPGQGGTDEGRTSPCAEPAADASSALHRRGYHSALRSRPIVAGRALFTGCACRSLSSAAATWPAR
jgi:hypothetical protein